MRTWYGYDAQGRLRSIEGHGGGWPPTADFNDPSTHGSIPGIVAARQAIGITGFYMYDCPCSPAKGTCNCHNDFVASNYIDGGAVKPKPQTTFMVNGVAYGMRAVVPVGATFKVQVAGAVPDGAEADIELRIPSLPQESIKLTFTGGVTAEHEFAMPIPTVASVGCWGKLVRSTAVSVLRPAP